MSATGPTRLDLVVNIRFPSERANGVQVAAMAEALAATGLNVSVVAPRRFPYQDVDVYAHYGVRRTFRVERIANIDTIDMVPPRFQRIPFLVQSATFGWRALARAAVERDAGILVRDHYTLDILVGGLRTRDVARLAAEVHNLPDSATRRRIAVGALARLPAVITISGALAEDLVRDGVDAGRILVARDGVFVARHRGLPPAPEARRHLGLEEAPTVVYAGQLFPWKGVDTLVAAMEHLPDARLLVVGGDKANLPRVLAAARRHADGRVIFTGRLPHRDVPFHLAAGDVVALPNTATVEISRRYTSPLKLFEAMAAHRAVVASDIPSLREVLTHDVNGWLVAPDDPRALAAGLGTLLEDDALRQRLADRALADVAQYDWSERGRCVAAFLRERLRVGRTR